MGFDHEDQGGFRFQVSLNQSIDTVAFYRNPPYLLVKTMVSCKLSQQNQPRSHRPSGRAPFPVATFQPSEVWASLVEP